MNNPNFRYEMWKKIIIISKYKNMYNTSHVYMCMEDLLSWCNPHDLFSFRSEDVEIAYWLEISLVLNMRTKTENGESWLNIRVSTFLLAKSTRSILFMEGRRLYKVYFNDQLCSPTHRAASTQSCSPACTIWRTKEKHPFITRSSDSRNIWQLMMNALRKTVLHDYIV